MAGTSNNPKRTVMGRINDIIVQAFTDSIQNINKLYELPTNYSIYSHIIYYVLIVFSF